MAEGAVEVGTAFDRAVKVARAVKVDRAVERDPGGDKVGDMGEAISPEGPLTEQDAEAYVASTCFKTGPPGQVGVELEWHVLDPAHPTAPVDPNRLATAFDLHLSGPDPLPAGGTLTREPGGQLELSSRPARTLTRCLADVDADVSLVRTRLAADGLALLGTGVDPVRRPQRVLEMPRYVAMEQFFDRSGPHGRTMMCSTAAVQVCLDAGADDSSQAGFRRRWRLAHLLGPVLVATFANSPLVAGRSTGWRSARQRVWGRLDPARTRPVWGAWPAGDGADPRAEWSRYALDAQVLCVRHPDGPWTVPAGLSFREWIRSRAPRPPTVDDLCYHLTTLFPPVRPRGWVELRMIDAQPGDGWVVPAVVATALIEDERAADAALAALEALWRAEVPTPRAGQGVNGDGSLWTRAAHSALADPSLARASRACFTAALDALPRLGVPEAVRSSAAAYYARYLERGRTPSDDLLAAWARGELPTGEEHVAC